MNSGSNFIPSSRHLLILFLFSVLLLLPAVLFGAGGFDVLVNCMKVRLFAAQFWHGDIYPRWLQDQYAGNGSPVFFYYPPLAYFITSFFIFLAPLDPFGYYPIAASVWLAAFIAGITFYLWMKDEEKDDHAALIGSLLYMSAPVMIGWQFNYLALFHSVWGWAWLPLLMMYARRVMLRGAYCVVGFALALAALIMTSVPMTVIFAPLAVAYSAFYCRKGQIMRQGATLGASVLLGFGLSAIFLIPATLYLDYCNARIMWAAIPTDYHHYFVILGFDELSQKVWTIVTLTMTALTLIYCVALRDRPKRYFFFAAASLAGLFMTIRASVFVWEIIPALKTLQLPARFFMVPSFCLAVLASVAAPRLRSLAYGLIVFYTACIFALSHMDAHVTEEGLRKYNHFKYEKYVLNIDFDAFLTSPDLLPKYLAAKNLAALDKPHNKVEVISGDAVVEVKQWRPRDIVLHYKATEPSTLRLWRFFFSGILAMQGDTILNASRDNDTGQILVEIPQGEGEVHLELTQLMPEIIGKMISMVSAAAIFLLFLLEMRRYKGGVRAGGANNA